MKRSTLSMAFTAATLVGLGAQAPVQQAARPLPASTASAAALALGARIYHKGVGAAGAVAASVQGDVPISGTAIPCVNCHRRSGWGTTEGKLTTPPVVGPVLFAPVTLGNPQIGIRTTGPGTRPAYDDRLLARALREGMGADGRTLSATMPRYALNTTDAAALTAYLRTLGSAPAAGVTDSTLHLATITTPTGNPRKRDAMMAVLRSFTDLKNAGTRNETRRRTNGPWDMKAHYELYRQWDLHEWSLKGAPETWSRQLREYCAGQPVFAIVSGIADGDWAPVHEFCEQQGVPCIFPQAAAPPDRGVDGGFYSLYYSRGVSLEAAALAQYLLRPAGAGPTRSILQVARCGSAGQRAADQLGAAVGTRWQVATRCLQPEIARERRRVARAAFEPRRDPRGLAGCDRPGRVAGAGRDQRVAGSRSAGVPVGKPARRPGGQRRARRCRCAIARSCSTHSFRPTSSTSTPAGAWRGSGAGRSTRPIGSRP